VTYIHKTSCGGTLYITQIYIALDTRAGGGAPVLGSRLSTLATCVRGANLTRGSQPAKLPSFGGYNLETSTLTQIYC